MEYSKLTARIATENDAFTIHCTVATLTDGIRAILPMDRVPENWETIELFPELFKVSAGDPGMYVLPEPGCGAITEFADRPDDEIETRMAVMPIYGADFGNRGIWCLPCGMRYNMRLVTSVKDGVYRMFPRLDRKSGPLYEDIAIELRELPEGECDYSAMARAYRGLRLERGEIRLLREKAEEREAVAYMEEAVEVRIRMGWKEAPPKILEQTRENEPPMHVACTFARVEELIDALTARGVEKLQLCLVGWNIRGHDGRWPEMFPVEPALGGEEGLTHLIRKAKEAGYRIVGHTNSTDCYSIAEDFTPDLPIRREMGEMSSDAQWSGGKMYELCPVYAQALAKRDLPRVKKLGFSGSHYIDVISTVNPRYCFSPEHPVTPDRCAELWNGILSLAADTFGAISSEGTFDYTAPVLDFGLYACFGTQNLPKGPIDGLIPLWQLVYNGVVMANPSTETVNYPVKPVWNKLRFMEYGGRPALYIYQNFRTNGSWMGKEDLLLDTEEDLERTADVIAETARDYLKFGKPEEKIMHSHRQITKELSEVLYEDGSVLAVNYGKKPAVYRGREIPAESALRLERGEAD